MTPPVLVIDFGSQVTQLIARRVREAGVYCEIVPYNKADAALARRTPRAIILSGGPASVTQSGTPRAPQRVFELGVPVLGICYGQMAMARSWAGASKAPATREFGRAAIDISGDCPLFDGVWNVASSDAGMDEPWRPREALPQGFRAVAHSDNAPFAVIADEKRRFYGVMFHPEVVHTPRGADLLRNFVLRIAGVPADWNMQAFRAEEIASIRRQVGKHA